MSRPGWTSRSRPTASRSPARGPGGDPHALGGSLLEEARLHGDPALLSVAPHAVAALAVDGADAPAIEAFTPTLDDADLLVQVAEHMTTETSGYRLPRPRSSSAGAGASARPRASDPRGAGGARRRGRLLQA